MIIRTTPFLIVLFAALLSLSACGQTSESNTENTAQSNNDIKDKEASMPATRTALLKTNKGEITLELNAEKAPLSVANFIQYAEAGHYNGTLFHRVIPGFMVQGGGFEPGMKQKPTQTPIQNEANNGLMNQTMTIAMARTNAPHSATSQFFINVSDNDFLNFTSESGSGWGYAVFGVVTEGEEVVKAIEGVATGQVGPYGDVPKEDVIIESVTILD
jgi:peptidyl-prolyl cis-trans isomerase B (cyclophilin B)